MWRCTDESLNVRFLVQRDERHALFDAATLEQVLAHALVFDYTLYGLPPAVISSAVLFPWSSGFSASSEATRPLTLRVSNPGGGVWLKSSWDSLEHTRVAFLCVDKFSTWY